MVPEPPYNDERGSRVLLPLSYVSFMGGGLGGDDVIQPNLGHPTAFNR